VTRARIVGPEPPEEADMRRTVFTLALLTLVAVPASPAGSDPLVRTVDVLRTVGRALYAWAGDHPVEAARAESPEAGAVTSVDLSDLPALSPEAAASLLVPAYLAELPAADGWGHPLEIRLSTAPTAPRRFAVRSPGADGRFEGSRYEVGSFAPDDPEADVVWADGYFVRWPARQD
jgi:hypothetical protein